ncbi:hypothetical protein TDB9533_01634 [Thalassocella blandensis]|nr:hypothetical protein TDB9533_01634 [Thalassocella blandensis]
MANGIKPEVKAPIHLTGMAKLARDTIVNQRKIFIQKLKLTIPTIVVCKKDLFLAPKKTLIFEGE